MWTPQEPNTAESKAELKAMFDEPSPMYALSLEDRIRALTPKQLEISDNARKQRKLR